MMTELFIQCKPRSKPRPRFSKGHAYTPTDYRKWEKKVSLAIKQHCQENALKPMVGPVVMHLQFFFKVKNAVEGPRAKKPDLDNLVKAVKDASNGILFIDDAQVWCCNASKHTTNDKEGIFIKCMNE